VSVAFVAAVVFTSIAIGKKLPIAWAPYAPLLPLALLAVTGVYMFFLPYAARWRNVAARRPA
jgi:hypothetical protein